MNRLFAVLAALLVAPAALAQEGGADPAAIQGKVESLGEQLAEVKTNVDALRKLRISGYIQARYAYQELNADRSANSGLYNDANTAQGPQRGNFFIRRGRFKAVYDADWSQFVMQLDVVPARQGGLSMKEGYAAIKLPAGFGLDVGLQLFPFGYEVASRSSSDLDLLERARVTRAFANGEYDLGAALRGNFAFVGLKNWNFKVGVFNGNGVDGPAAADRGADTDQLKDVIGRITYDYGFVTGGFSGWWGKAIDYSRADDKEFKRDRVAADVQIYLDLLPLGGTALKGEYMWGHLPIGAAFPAGDAPVPTGSGWYGQITQNVLDHWQLAARYDRYTPNHTANVDTGATVKVQNEVQVALHTFVGEGGKVTLAWWHPMNGDKGPTAPSDPKADTYVVQVQAKF